MKRDSLDLYDKIPEGMTNYLRYYGRHFNRKLCEYAVDLISDLFESPMTKSQLDDILKQYNVVLKNNALYDYVYVANMCQADFLGSSIKDMQGLALYVKDVIDDRDAYDGVVFNRWYADMTRKGLPIEWDDML